MGLDLRSAATSVIHGESAIWPALTSGVIVAVASYLVGPKRGDVRVDVALASIASFLFGILMAFTIVRTRERLAVVQNLLSHGNASLLSIHQLMEVLPEDVRLTIRDLIDRQLTDQIDYRLVDNYRSAPTHLALTNAVIALEPQTRQEEVVYKEAVEICIDMGANRALIEAASGQALSPMEWTGMLLLLLLLMALIAVLPGGTIWGALVAGVMAATLVTLVILLRKLDRLRWHERTSIWEPTARLFRSMGRDPYVPREVIDNGRYRPTGRVRVADYPHSYPDRTGKTVTLEDFDPIAPSLTAVSLSEQTSRKSSRLLIASCCLFAPCCFASPCDDAPVWTDWADGPCREKDPARRRTGLPAVRNGSVPRSLRRRPRSSRRLRSVGGHLPPRPGVGGRRRRALRRQQRHPQLECHPSGSTRTTVSDHTYGRGHRRRRPSHPPTAGIPPPADDNHA